MKKALFPSWSQQVLSNYYCVTIIIYRCNVFSLLNLLQFDLCRFVLFLICCLLMLSCICYNVAILITKSSLIKVFQCMLDITGGQYLQNKKKTFCNGGTSEFLKFSAYQFSKVKQVKTKRCCAYVSCQFHYEKSLANTF